MCREEWVGLFRRHSATHQEDYRQRQHVLDQQRIRSINYPHARSESSGSRRYTSLRPRILIQRVDRHPLTTHLTWTGVSRRR